MKIMFVWLAASIMACCVIAAEPDTKAVNYTLKDGVFSVPLTVRENQGVGRKNWPTTFGVPLPAGLVKEPADLRLLDDKGVEVPCQFSATSRYWARDNSVRWVLLDFQAEVAANGSAIYRLVNDKPAKAIKNGVVVNDGAAALTVSSGPLKIVISKKQCNLFENVSVDGREIIKATEHDGPRATAEAQSYMRCYGGDWNLHGWDGMKEETGKNPIKRADYFGDVGLPDEVVIERAGPIHTIVRVRGAYRPVEQGPDVLKYGVYNFTYRIHFYKDADYVRVEHSVENSRFEEPRFMTKLLDHSLWSTVVMNGDMTVSYGGVDGEPKKEEIKTGGGFCLSSNKIQEVNAQWVDVSCNGMSLGVATRTRIGPQAAVDFAGGKLAVRPYSIYCGEANPLTNLTVNSWGRGGFQLDFGSRTTYDYFYRFASGTGTSLKELSKGMLWPLFGFAPAEWYADSGVWNMELSPANLKSSKINDDTALDLYGKEAVGIFNKMDFNSGGHHGNLSSLNDSALLSQNLKNIQKNWAAANQAVDFYQWNYRGYEPVNDHAKLSQAHRMIMFGSKDIYLYGKRGQNMGSSMLSYKYLPDAEHYGFMNLWEQYYLWGDDRARDSLRHFANFALVFQWDVQFLREGEKNGIPSLENVDYYDKHHEALYRSHYARIYSWQLYTPLQAFQATGDPVYDLISKWQMRRLSHLQRLSRGIPEAWVQKYWSSYEQKHWKTVDYPKEVTDFEYVAQAWQIAKTMLGFHEAYKTYGDEEILDNIWGETDYFKQVPWRGSKKGIPNAPTIPATLMGTNYNANIFDPNYHMRTAQALALAWYYTGDKDIRQRMNDHVEGIRGSTWGHLTCWIENKKSGRDKPPDKIADFACIKTDRGGLKFEWTAPKGYGKSGRAVKYFIKYSSKPMVQWAPVNNPDAPADVWADKKKHMYKPECWHPDFLKKDAFWMGTHVDGEPVPGDAGKKEKCVITTVKPHNYYGLTIDKMPKIKDLPAGKYYFAICAWDEDNNLNDISNLVEVDLK